MGNISDAAFDSGDVMRRITTLSDAVKFLQTVRSLESAAIGRGGLRVHDGGGIRVHDGGDVMLLGGGNLWVVDGGNAVIEEGNLWVLQGGSAIVDGGGAFEARDGSRIRARYADGSTAVVWGSLITADTGEESGHGLLVQDDQAGDGGDIFRAVRRENGNKLVLVGSPQHPIDRTVTYTDELELASTGDAFLAADGGAVVIISDDDQVFIEHQTTGAAANCHITENGLIARSTSARRYKVDLADYVPPPTILDLAPRTYRDKREAEQAPQDARTYVGLVAEEVHALGLTEYVTYDQQGQPNSVMYDRLAVGLLGVVQTQQAQIDALTAWASQRGYQAPGKARETPRPAVPSLTAVRAASPARPARASLNAGADGPAPRSAP